MKGKHTVELIVCAVLAVLIIALTATVVILKSQPESSADRLPDEPDTITAGMEYSAVIDTQMLDEPGGEKVLAQIAKDTKVNFLAYTDTDFYKVKYGDVCGFVDGDYIVDSELLESIAESRKVRMYVVNVEKSARLYEQSNTESTALANVSVGTQVVAVNGVSENGFIEVDYNNLSGYIEEKYLSKDAPTEQ